MIVENSRQAQANVSGRAEVRIGPPTAVQTWKVAAMVSTVTNSPTESQLLVYKNTESPSQVVNSSVSANNAVSTGDDVILQPGDQLLFVWSGATPGAWCTASIRGESI